MSRLIFNEREEPTEHWSIAIRTDSEAFSAQYFDHPYEGGYDRVHIFYSSNLINIIVHNLSRLETILDIALIKKELSIKIQQHIHGIYS